jgi:hypothetical protein
MRYFLARAVKIVAIVAVVLAVVGFVAMSLWNWLVPALFSGPMITYWQALGLIVLSRLLFGGLHRSGGPWRHGGRFARHAMHRRWKSMSPEERERMREQLRHRWGESHL